jgi:hypothetical protein
VPATGTFVLKAVPVLDWQSVQWQIATLSGSASASNVMEPQLQLPWIFIVYSVRFARMDVTAFGDELKAREYFRSDKASTIRAMPIVSIR